MSTALLKQRKGQSMTEYILIVALIAIAVLFAVRIFGSRIRQAFKTAGETISQEVEEAEEEGRNEAGQK